MREILSLMFPIHFRGNIYHKAAMFICLPFLVTVGALSIWSNLHGVESFFSSLPGWALTAAKVAVVFIDPVNWLCLTLLIVTIAAFAVSEKLEKSGHIDKQLVRVLKPKLVLASIVFACLVSALTYATFLLSDNGAEKGAAAYVDERYKPEIGLDSILQANKQVLKQELSSVQGAYAAKISDLRSRLSAAQKAKAASKNWDAKGKGRENWKMYNAHEAAKKEIAEVQQLLESTYQAIERKQAGTMAASNELLEAQKASYTVAASNHEKKAAEATESMFWAVRSWTALGLLIQLVSCILTFDLYQKSAYAFIGQEARAYDNNMQDISSEIERISRDKQVLKHYEQSHKQEQKPVKQQFDNHEQLPFKSHKQDVKQVSTRASEPQQAIEATPVDSDAEIMEAIRARHSSNWLQQWKHALTDDSLIELSKKAASEKFGCSISTIDNLRRSHTSLASFVPDSKQLKRILEKI